MSGFKLIEKVDIKKCKEYKLDNRTIHSNRRNYREYVIKNILDENRMLHVVSMFKCDKGHPNGPELHKVTKEGIIEIFNYNSKKFITFLIARPQQIKRYYEFFNEEAPGDIVKIAEEHQRLNLNNA